MSTTSAIRDAAVPAARGATMAEMADTDAYYILNGNEGIDILHRNPREQCNTQSDEMKGRERIDSKTADALIATDQARWCEYCRPDE